MWSRGLVYHWLFGARWGDLYPEVDAVADVFDGAIAGSEKDVGPTDRGCQPVDDVRMGMAESVVAAGRDYGALGATARKNSSDEEVRLPWWATLRTSALKPSRLLATR